MKRLLSLVLAMMLLSTLVAAGSVFAKNDINILMNGKTMNLDEKPFIQGDRVLVPVRFVAEEFGGQVVWDAKARSATIDTKYFSIQLTVNKKLALIYHKYDFTGLPQEVTLDVAANIIRGRLFVPLRFVAETFGLNVNYDKKTRNVIIEGAPDIIGVETPVDYKAITFRDIESNKKLAEWYESHSRVSGIHSIFDNGKAYVLICAGEKRTGGYSVVIESVTLVDPETVYIGARLNSPAPGSMVTTVITYPHILISFDMGKVSSVQGDIAGNGGALPGQTEYKDFITSFSAKDM